MSSFQIPHPSHQEKGVELTLRTPSYHGPSLLAYILLTSIKTWLSRFMRSDSIAGICDWRYHRSSEPRRMWECRELEKQTPSTSYFRSIQEESSLLSSSSFASCRCFPVLVLVVVCLLSVISMWRFPFFLFTTSYVSWFILLHSSFAW